MARIKGSAMKTRFVSARLSEADYQKLKEQCVLKGMSRTDYLTEALHEKFLKEEV